MRRSVRLGGMVAIGMMLLGATTLGALRLDDPVPGFAARRGEVASVTRDEATVEEGHRIEAVTVRSTSGVTVPMLVKRPLADSAAPLVLILGGHATGRDAARLIPDTRGRVVVALSYPYTGPHRMKGLEILKWAPDIRQALHDTPPAIQLALDWLLQQPWVNAREVHGVGASLGTPFMTVAAALDPRITHVWSVHGAGRTRDLLAHNAQESMPALFAPLAGTLADVIVGGPYLTPEKWVQRVAPRPYTMLNATEDERLPRPAIEALYAAASEPKAIVWFPGKHVQPNRPEIVRALVTTVLQRMEQHSAPSAVPAN
ncbi:hypothetical protein [Gemmatimonas sp.]|jgi:dienelactone hydrolase|uniref:hypothetical protein n=1 Tax=Gemmatimonas sp. TaxID=1962908 RepID=UPI0025B97F25|nr:hypothetical protein [Gemmatimonas sp.]MCA2988827.1 hypothetical protein [Gemmatimonas sp.]